MEKFNHLDELPIANLNYDQLNLLQTAEQSMNKEKNEEIYIIAFKKSKE
ncbi:MAG TPA: hypothetical protein VJ824_05685 [Bacillota bacterium]|nr:hypothetical protein [Bacillota bacterium]